MCGDDITAAKEAVISSIIYNICSLKFILPKLVKVYNHL
jgi:hypothetical protein